MIAEDKHGPGLKFPPPLLVLAVIGVAWLADRVRPLPISSGEAPLLLGVAVIVIAVLLALLALVHFIEARTKLEPWQPTSTVIQKGLFRYSRNPIYLSYCIATIGTGLVLNSWWIVVGVTMLKPLLERFVISREEAYLEKKFGDSYLQYKDRVRRWL